MFPILDKTVAVVDAPSNLGLERLRDRDKLTRFDGFHPLVLEEDAAAFGFREVENRETYAAREIFRSRIRCHSLDEVRGLGIRSIIHSPLERFSRNSLDGFWIHLDADALDNAIMPAVDSPQPGGLRYDELVETLRMLLGSSMVAGMEITIYNPDLDSDGSIARSFVQALVASFRS